MTKKTNPKDTPSLIGYARVSTVDQSVTMQIEALMKYGVRKEDIFSESLSGVKKNRPETDQSIEAIARRRHASRMEAGPHSKVDK